MAPVLFLGAVLVAGAGPWADRLDGAHPNVLIIVMDDVSDRDIDILPTPRFDELAARGIRFRRAYAAPVCSQARRMLSFGTYWARDSGSPCEGRSLGDRQPSTEAISLPRLFVEADYQTVLVGKWHLGSYPRVEEGAPWELAAQQHGYESWRAGVSANVFSSCIRRGSYTFWQRVDDGSSRESTEYNTWAVRDEAIAWIETAEVDSKPWFAMVCFQAPHPPFHVPPSFEEPEDKLTHREMYVMMVEELDRAIGSILDAVDLQHTVVVLVGDNGTPHMVHGPLQAKRRVKGTTYEGGIRVPMVWAGVDLPAGVESEALVSLVDVLPTFAAMIGAPGVITAKDQLDGISILPTLMNPAQPAHDFVWSGFQGANSARQGDYAIVTDRWKLRLAGGEAYLFDLNADPNEGNNLAGRPKLSDVQTRLQELVQRWMP